MNPVEADLIRIRIEEMHRQAEHARLIKRAKAAQNPGTGRKRRLQGVRLRIRGDQPEVAELSDTPEVQLLLEESAVQALSDEFEAQWLSDEPAALELLDESEVVKLSDKSEVELL